MDVTESTAFQQTTNVSSRSTHDIKGTDLTNIHDNSGIEYIMFCNEASGTQFQ